MTAAGSEPTLPNKEAIIIKKLLTALLILGIIITSAASCESNSSPATDYSSLGSTHYSNRNEVTVQSETTDAVQTPAAEDAPLFDAPLAEMPADEVVYDPYIPPLPDGSYRITLYADLIFDTAEGLRATIEVMTPVTFSTEYVTSLQPGHVIALGQYGLQDIYVEQIAFNPEPFPAYDLNNIYYFAQAEWAGVSGGGDEWYLVGTNDYVYRYASAMESLLFAPDAVVIDELTAYATGVGTHGQQLADIRSIFDSPAVDLSASVDIVISGGVVTEVLLYFHP